jgi:hypothetical protein
MIGVLIDNSGLQAKVSRAQAAARNPRGIMAAAGRECGNQLKNHFRGKDQSEANKLGGPREHFWNRVAQSVSAPVVAADGRALVISITQPGYAQKVYGGIITAKRVRNLAIPETPEAYGRSPATFERETGAKLFVVKTARATVLARRIESAGGGGLQVEYLLTPSVNQAADPTALPDMEQLAEAMAARAESALATQLKIGEREDAQ